MMILSLKEIPFSRRSSQDKLTIKELGPQRPNLKIKQDTLSIKSGKNVIEDFRGTGTSGKNG